MFGFFRFFLIISCKISQRFQKEVYSMCVWFVIKLIQLLLYNLFFFKYAIVIVYVNWFVCARLHPHYVYSIWILRTYWFKNVWTQSLQFVCITLTVTLSHGCVKCINPYCYKLYICVADYWARADFELQCISHFRVTNSHFKLQLGIHICAVLIFFLSLL